MDLVGKIETGKDCSNNLPRWSGKGHRAPGSRRKDEQKTKQNTTQVPNSRQGPKKKMMRYTPVVAQRRIGEPHDTADSPPSGSATARKIKIRTQEKAGKKIGAEKTPLRCPRQRALHMEEHRPNGTRRPYRQFDFQMRLSGWHNRLYDLNTDGEKTRAGQESTTRVHDQQSIVRLVLKRRLCRGKSRDRYAIRTATDVVQSHLMTKVDR